MACVSFLLTGVSGSKNDKAIDLLLYYFEFGIQSKNMFSGMYVELYV